MRRFILGVILACTVGGLAGAVADRLAHANLLQAATGGSFSPSCSQSTAWFGRIAAPGAPYNTAYDTMICGMVTDGVWALLDALWILAAPNTTDALLNLVSTSFTLTVNGSPAFVAARGYTGTAVNPAVNWLDTGFNPLSSGTHFTQDAAHLSVWSLTDLQSSSSAVGLAMGTSDSSANASYIIPWYSDGTSYGQVNDLTTSPSTATVGHSIGSWIITRSAGPANSSNFYRNGANISSNSGGVSTVRDNCNGYILAYDVCLASPPNQAGAALQIPAASYGGSLTAAQVSSLGSTPVTASNAAGATGLVPRICAYLVAIGNVACN